VVPSKHVSRRSAVERFGRYELLTELGRGGMAELHLAQLRGVGGFSKTIAIKRILPHVSQDPQFVEMFLNEGRISARMSHPNVCQVFELGEESGRLYLAMEYLQGVPWSVLVKRLDGASGTQRARTTCAVVAQALEGLQSAHDLGVIHRDVSPQNLFVTVDGVCKVLDFGVSKWVDQHTTTRSGVLKGKLPYMAPEQIKGDPVDARADVFAAGVVLWEGLTGELLFHRGTDFQIWQAITNDSVAPISAKVPEVGMVLDDVVAKALARDREHRFASARAFADELRRATEAIGGVATAAELGALARERCGDEIDARAALVTTALSNRRDEHSSAETMLDSDPSAAETIDQRPPAATIDDLPRGGGSSMQLRADPIPLGARTSRRSLVVLLLALVVAGAAALVFANRSGPAQRPAVASRQALDALPDVDAAVRVVPADASVVASVDAKASRVDGGTRTRPTPASSRDAGTTTTTTATATTAAANAAPGYFSIDSQPYATIFVDGQRLPGNRAQTPLFRLPLPPGRHGVRAVLADGREQTFTIEIESGKELNWRRLTW
jgi:serine/threonine-protein kinase